MNMTQLAVVTQSNSLNMWECAEQLMQIKEIYGKDLSLGEFNTLVQIGKATKLNPFLREIWAVKYGNNPASIFIGRDGYRKNAQANPDYDYHLVDAVYTNDEFEITHNEVRHRYILKDRGLLVGAYCSVKRRSSSKAIYVYVDLKEYSTGKSQWQQRPATMIKKVAEAQALRMAFQELFAGTYNEEEVDYVNGEVVSETEKLDAANSALGIKQLTIEEMCEDLHQTKSLEDLQKLYSSYYKKVHNDSILCDRLIEAKDMAKLRLSPIPENPVANQTNDEWVKDYDGKTTEVAPNG